MWQAGAQYYYIKVVHLCSIRISICKNSYQVSCTLSGVQLSRRSDCSARNESDKKSRNQRTSNLTYRACSPPSGWTTLGWRQTQSSTAAAPRTPCSTSAGIGGSLPPPALQSPCYPPPQTTWSRERKTFAEPAPSNDWV